MLDEPAAGLAAAEADELRKLIVDIRSKYDCGVLVIEHNMALVMNLCERIHVLDSGRTIAEGTPIGNTLRCRRPPRLPWAQHVAMTSGTPLLAVSGLVVRYGAVTAVRGIDLQVDEGEIVSIVGPNGAGKSSLISAIAGIVTPASGTMTFGAKSLSGIPLEDVVAHSIALVPEGRHIFASLTVSENLLLGATARRDAGAVPADIDRLFAMFPILAERRRQPAGLLSGGEQQQLAIARALLSRPRLIMLDEPSLGLAPTVVDRVYELLRTIRQQGVTILLVEQNAERVFGVSSRVYVMSGGEFALSGDAAAIKNNPHFDAAYFGVHMREAGEAASRL